MVRADEDLRALFDRRPAADVLDAAPRRSAIRARSATRFDALLEDWGFRCSAELMLTVPSFQEDAAPLIDLLKAYVAMEGESPADLLARQAAERIRETRAVLAALAVGRCRCSCHSSASRSSSALCCAGRRRSIQLRERARLKQALLYSRLRRVALAIGDRLVANGRIVEPPTTSSS